MRTRLHSVRLVLLTALWLLPATVFAQSPWDTAATRLQTSFQGTLATALSIVAVIVGGFVVAFGDGAAKRVLAGLIAGVALVIGASNWITWLFR